MTIELKYAMSWPFTPYIGKEMYQLDMDMSFSTSDKDVDDMLAHEGNAERIAFLKEIVLACNSHDKLVEALKLAKSLIESDMRIYGDIDQWRLARDCQIIESALKLAKQ